MIRLVVVCSLVALMACSDAGQRSDIDTRVDAYIFDSPPVEPLPTEDYLAAGDLLKVLKHKRDSVHALWLDGQLTPDRFHGLTDTFDGLIWTIEDYLKQQ